MPILTSPAGAAAAPQTRWIPRARDAAIFASCANLYSTALANVALFVFLVMLACVLAGPERRKLAWSTFPRGVALAIGLYLGWQVLGMVYTDAPLASAWQSLYADRKILYILPFALLFGTEAAKRRFLAAFLIANAVALVLSFLMVAPSVSHLIGRQPTAVLHSHVTQGMSFAMAFFLSLWYMTQAKDRRWRAFFLVLALGFLVNIVIVTTGRSGYVAFLVFIVACYGFWRGPRGILLGLGAAALISLSIFYASSTVRERVMLGVHEATHYMEATGESSLGRRMLLYHVTLELIAAHPILGTGTGSFKAHFSNTVAQRYNDWKAVPFHDPHNQYLFVWAENGLPGLAAFLFLLVSLYRACDKRTPYGQMAAASLLAWCATSLFSGHFRTFPEGHMIAFVLGALMTRIQPEPAAPGTDAWR
ncbi:MAG: O-antigen ligase protein [Ramlibacter sp.]|jgi:O-antigen ligase|nr:O-antigen ligase protein [Ramlibacter sp.]